MVEINKINNKYSTEYQKIEGTTGIETGPYRLISKLFAAFKNDSHSVDHDKTPSNSTSH